MSRDFSASSYLAFRWVVRSGMSWSATCAASRPPASEPDAVRAVRDAGELIDGLLDLSDHWTDRCGLLLSGGMDSAILASFMPPGRRAYTIRFGAPGAVDEAERAAVYARRCGLRHRVVEVDWKTYESAIDDLSLAKGAPLHPVESGLYAAACAARDDGLDRLIVGNGADSNFGGLDQLLAVDWTIDDFKQRYNFVDPVRALVSPVSVDDVYTPYTRADGTVDVAGFLHGVHGPGITQAFENAIGLAGLGIETPYERLCPAEPLDLERIRSGDSKYLVRDVFRKLYPELKAPDKVAFARPMNRWMRNWIGPHRPELRCDIEAEMFNPEQRWLLYSLERFLDRIDLKSVH